MHIVRIILFKSEIRISNIETNTNNKNINDQNGVWSYHETFV